MNGLNCYLVGCEGIRKKNRVGNNLIHKTVDLYEAFKANPREFPQFSLQDTLFLHYSCPQRDRVIQVYAKHIQFSFTLSGKRHWHHGEKTWTATPGSGLIVKKSAFIQELPSDVMGWDVMVFYLKDSYLRRLLEAI